MWTLAASLVLAVGLAAWWTTALHRENGDWASHKPTVGAAVASSPDSAARFDFGPEMDARRNVPQHQGFANHGLASAGLQSAALQQLRQAPGAGSMAGLRSLCESTAAADGSGLPLNAAEAPKAATHRPIPAGPHSPSQADRAASSPGMAAGAPAQAAPAALEGRGGGIALRRSSEPTEEHTGLDGIGLRDFTILRLTPMLQQEQPLIRFEVIEGRDGVIKQRLAQNLASEREARRADGSGLALIAPTEAPGQHNAQANNLIGVPRSAVPALGPGNIAPPNVLAQSARPNTAPEQFQFGNVRRQPLVNAQVRHEFVAPLPSAELQNSAMLIVEVPVDQGSLNLGQHASAVRLPVSSFPYVPAIRLEYAESAKRLCVQVIALDGQTLKFAGTRMQVVAQLFSDAGQPLGQRVVAIQRAFRLHAETAQGSGWPAKYWVYEACLPWSRTEATPCWLQIGEEGGMLPTVNLLLRSSEQKGGSRNDSDERLQQPQGQGTKLPFHVSPDFDRDLAAWACTGEALSESPDAAVFWSGAICCSEPNLAWQLGLAAQNPTASQALERSVYDRIRAHWRKQAGDWQPHLTRGGFAQPTDWASRSARHEETRRVAEFLLQLIPSQERAERRIVVAGFGVLFTLGWLALACGIFGAVSGRAPYLMWSRRILSVIVALVALWWAWTSVEARTPSEQNSAASVQTTPSAAPPLVQRP
ncbi:hypothetical protein HRbin36_02083 [bacterium HR36]|nr:hypothetical protein HRbin36_02083 [bacterium HR36]